MDLPETKIEFVELTEDEFIGVPGILPNVIRINGSPVVVERDSVEILGPWTSDDCVRVRLTLIPGKVVFKSEAYE